jgi:large subunit ribosomal protein L25
MSTFELSANTRTIFGRKTKQLRNKGVVPANIFGKKIKSVPIELDKAILVDVMRKAGETGLINLTIKGEEKARPVLIAGYAQNPVSDELLHVDFHEVDLKQKTTAAVPVHTVGESPAVEAGNILVLLRNEIEVEALPTDLPDAIEVDITGLVEVGDTVHAKDLKVDRSKVELDIEDEEPVVTIQEPAKEEVIEPPAEAEGAEAVEGEKSAEGEDAKPADAEAKPEEKKE